MKNYFLSLPFALLAMVGINAHSGEFLVDAAAGIASVGEGDYDYAGFIDVSGGYEFSALSLKGGVLAFSEFENENNRDFAIQVNGVYVGIAKNISFKVIEFEVGAGLVAAESEATFRGDEIATDNDTSPYINAMILQPLPGPVLLFGQYKYIDDLSGTDIHLFEAGARIKF